MPKEETKTKTEIETSKDGDKVVELTQKKIDELVAKGYSAGAKSIKGKESKTILSELGVDSLDSLKTLLAEKAEADKKAKAEAEAKLTADEKTAKSIEALTKTVKNLENNNKTLQEKLELEKEVAKYDIADSSYYKHLKAMAMKENDFKEDKFVEQLKKEKPYLFKTTDKKVVDASNPVEVEVKDKISQAKTMKELRELQKSL